ncbi:hypothetical protein FOZ76_11710 [Verticiella sediminum]|uniref:Lipoprotein n=1 Tax=Verticiella sediminum TaxID=1247510 RepID=A0A556APL1_9BURK|nr:hypothetical protein [Verticiella sediminum]TSH94803.1 hypothetical protein FOZ76_11710 [Verticiella sediminum]
MIRIAIACGALALAGCAAAPTVRTVTVEVPVPVPCRIEKVERPTWAMDALPAGARLYETVRAALVEIEQRQGYEARLEAALLTCR